MPPTTHTPAALQETGKFFFRSGATYQGEYILAGAPPKSAPTPEPLKKGALPQLSSVLAESCLG